MLTKDAINTLISEAKYYARPHCKEAIDKALTLVKHASEEELEQLSSPHQEDVKVTAPGM